MSKKKIIIILLIAFFVDLIFLGFVLYLNAFGNQIINTAKINLEYNLFLNNSIKFNNQRDEIIETILNGAIIEKAFENSDINSEKLKKYENILNELDNNSPYMKTECFSGLITGKYKNKCDSYKGSFEKAYNYFVSDIDFYNNEIISKYNELNTGKTLSFYKSDKYKTYIDFNNDKIFEGNEEN